MVGVLGTSLALALYRDRFSHMGLEVVMLDDHEQVEFMALLYRIKQGDLGAASRETMAALAHRLVGKGAQSVVAGCTEVPLVLSAADLSVPFLGTVAGGFAILLMMSLPSCPSSWGAFFAASARATLS